MTPKICIIGAGFSGIAAGVQLKKQLNIDDYVIFDENEDVGGTWLVNKYPGCACDVASHLYSYSFEPNPDWSWAYSPQQEIWRYLQRVAKKHDLYKNMKFSHKVNKVAWDETINKWRLVVTNTVTNDKAELIFDLIISGIGGLRVPHTPEEFKAFTGTRIHSAEWDTSVKLEDKTVAVIGSGASAVQIIPNIVKKVKKLIVYQRHPAWVLPRMQFQVPDWLKWAFASVPGLREMYRSFIFLSNELAYPTFIQGSLMQKLGAKLGDHYLNRKFADNPALLEKVRPNYELGCKRITPSNEYYPALAHPNVEVVRDKITKVGTNSITTENGDEKKIDVLILATGFKVQEFFSPLEIRVKGGMDLMELWREKGPSAYMGICSSVAPNWFMLLGPNTGLGHNSIIFTIECQLNYVLQVIKEMIERDSKVVCVKEFIEQGYMVEMMEDMKPMVWGTGCASWYADSRGVVTALSPYTLMTCWRHTRTLNENDFNFN
ncbi:baeyer-Villiger monooxygenase [Folsomia candida]|uniref:Flavin-containing monooxygenase n=1 Tax=Folsomia candida TaxID=158441 RepID=A0A226DRV6_FOLCA|nr:baeyer-Villiger monooxygenase [Folsomia candida]OXA47564.1 Baeyer-Villiger monooxygenase [Folsomia candida]